MTFKKHCAFAGCLLLLSSINQMTYADGLDDLKQALTSLKGTEPLTAVLASTIENKDMDDNIKNGQVEVLLTDGGTGLQVTYSNHVLQQLELESMQRIEDEEAQTPTINALNRLDTSDFRNMVTPAFSIDRRINQAEFVGEEAIDYQGKEARLLKFNMPMEALITSKSARGYVDDFEGSYQVIVDANGTPLESKIAYHGEGSAYLIINVDAFGNSTSKYAVVNNRLVTIEHQHQSGIDSTFGESELSINNSLRIDDIALASQQPVSTGK